MTNWLVAQGLTGLPEHELIRGFCERCCAEGIPLSYGLVVIDTLHPDTELRDQILIYGKIDGRNATTVPAGSYDAVYIYRIVQLDDEEFWRTRTTRRDAVWYAPEVKAPVREAREAEYTEKGGGPDIATIRTESTVLELVSFRPGK